jgi:hypothetical protein
LALLLLWTGCASDEAERGPSKEERCATEVTDLQAYVARVAGSRGSWSWPLRGDVVVREADSFPGDGGRGRLGLEVSATGPLVSASDGQGGTFAEALARRGDARLAIAFHADVPLARVRAVLDNARAAGATDLDLVFAQYKPTGPPEPSAAHPLIERLSSCDDCGPLRAQLRTRIAGGCLPLVDAVWTDDIDDAASFDERVPAARAWAGRMAAGMEECACEGVDIPGLWDVVWERLKDPRPLTAVPLRLALPETRARKKRKRARAAADPREVVRTIALPEDVPWSFAHAAFVEAAPFPVRFER